MSLKKKFIFFCFAGAIGALTELIFFNVFFIFLNFIESKILSLTIAITLNFTINRNITFLARSGKLTKQAIKYIVVYSIAILSNFSISVLANQILGPGTINANIATTTGIIGTIPITFLGLLLWVFKNKHN